MTNKVEVFWSGYDEDEAENVLNTQHSEKIMLKMNDGLFVIVSPKEFIIYNDFAKIIYI